MYLLIRVKSLMGLKFWRSWGVDKKNSKLQQVRVFLKNHAQLHVSGVFLKNLLKNSQKSRTSEGASLPSQIKPSEHIASQAK